MFFCTRAKKLKTCSKIGVFVVFTIIKKRRRKSKATTTMVNIAADLSSPHTTVDEFDENDLPAIDYKKQKIGKEEVQSPSNS